MNRILQPGSSAGSAFSSLRTPRLRFLTGLSLAGRSCALILLASALALAACPTLAAQSNSVQSPSAGQAAPATPAKPAQTIPPLKPIQILLRPAEPCMVKNTGATVAATGAMRAFSVAGLSGIPRSAGTTPVITKVCMPRVPLINWYARFMDGPEVKPLTPDEKGWLAMHNVLDPFNLLTITGEAAISVAANSHSPYGPGVPGWGRYTGVSFTQDLTGEFFGTFLIPSLVHQDPHYHRMPNASIKSRIFHAAAQVLWTQGDNGKGMINYADLVGFAADDAISNLYVPGQQTRFSATASRYGIGLATAPIDNYVTEFLPDVARHVHVQIVIIQRVINQVARTENTAQ